MLIQTKLQRQLQYIPGDKNNAIMEDIIKNNNLPTGIPISKEVFEIMLPNLSKDLDSKKLEEYKKLPENVRKELEKNPEFQKLLQELKKKEEPKKDLFSEPLASVEKKKGYTLS